jgi:hypothetical protein
MQVFQYVYRRITYYVSQTISVCLSMYVGVSGCALVSQSVFSCISQHVGILYCS